MMSMKRGAYASAVVYIALGLIMLIDPIGLASALYTAVGAVLVVYGIVKIISFFAGDAGRPGSFDLVLSGLCIIVGAFLIFKTAAVIGAVHIIIGIIIAAGGLAKLQSAITLRRMRGEGAALNIAWAIICILLGIIVVINPFGGASALWRVAGASFLVEGALEIYLAVCISRAERGK